MKKIIVPILLLCVSCIGFQDPDGFDPWGNNQGGKQEGGQSSGDSSSQTGPTSSDIDIDDESGSKDNVDNSDFTGPITITFSEASATVEGSVDDVSVTCDGARVTATNNGKENVRYILTGKSGDGSFKLYSSSKQEIELDDLTLSNTRGAAINNQSKKKTFIVLKGTNTISDGSLNNSGDYAEETEAEDMKAAFFSEGQLIFSGDGSLKVTATGKGGITSDDYIRVMTGPSVTVNSTKGHGIRGKDAIIVSGGTINVTLESSATGKKCMTSDSLVYIGGGKVILTNKASAGTVDSELTGAAGIKADKIFLIKGGELSVTASGKGAKAISGDCGGFFEGGKVNAVATGANYGSSSSNKFPGGSSSSTNSVSSKSIKFDGNLEFSGAEVTASAKSHEAIESKGTISISAGCVSATSCDDAINSSSTMTISGGVVYAYSTGNDGLDANGNLYITGGTVFAIGTNSPEVGIDANTEDGYKLYIQGGNVIAIGGLERNSSVSQNIISVSSWYKNTYYTLCDGEKVLFTIKSPASEGSGLYMSTPELVKGSKYTLLTSSTVTGATSYAGGVISLGGTATGGDSSSVTAAAYTSTGGGGGGGGGGGRPGGWW